MTLTPLLTITLSIVSSLFFVFVVYGVHSYLIPYRRNSRYHPEPTLPFVEKTANPALRSSLYSLPTINYIDPRNSLINYELRSSRWSTFVPDLSPTSSKHNSDNLTKSPATPQRSSNVQYGQASFDFDRFTTLRESQPSCVGTFAQISSGWESSNNISTRFIDPFDPKQTTSSTPKQDPIFDHTSTHHAEFQRIPDSASISLNAVALWLQAQVDSDNEAGGAASFHSSKKQEVISLRNTIQSTYGNSDASLALSISRAVIDAMKTQGISSTTLSLTIPSTNSSWLPELGDNTGTSPSANSFLNALPWHTMMLKPPGLPRTCRLADAIESNQVNTVICKNIPQVWHVDIGQQC